MPQQLEELGSRRRGRNQSIVVCGVHEGLEGGAARRFRGCLGLFRLIGVVRFGTGNGVGRRAGGRGARGKATARFEVLAEQPPADRVEFELDEQLFELLFPGRTKFEAVELHLDRRVAIDGGQSLGEQRLFAVLLQVFAQLAFELAGVFEQILDAAVLRDQFARGLLTDARHAGNVVRGVTPQSEDVDHLFRPGHAPFLAHLGKTQDFGGVTRATRFVDEGLLRDELAEILVRRDHVGFEALLFGPADESADDVVGLVTVADQRRDGESLEQPPDIGQGPGNVLRHGLALDLVIRKLTVPLGRHFRVEGDGDVRGQLVLQDIEQRIREHEQGGGVGAFG